MSSPSIDHSLTLMDLLVETSVPSIPPISCSQGFISWKFQPPLYHFRVHLSLSQRSVPLTFCHSLSPKSQPWRHPNKSHLHSSTGCRVCQGHSSISAPGESQTPLQNHSSALCSPQLCFHCAESNISVPTHSAAHPLPTSPLPPAFSAGDLVLYFTEENRGPLTSPHPTPPWCSPLTQGRGGWLLPLPQLPLPPQKLCSVGTSHLSCMFSVSFSCLFPISK